MNIKYKTKIICDICSKEFFVCPSRSFGKHKRKVCSLKCSGILTSQRKPILGRKVSEETRFKLSASLKGKSTWNKGLKGFRKGEKRPNIMPSGKFHWSWKGGISKDVHSTSEPKYKEWRMKVFMRDNFRCKMCQSKENLQAHHILRWSEYPELRYDINNGIALCRVHHPRKMAEEKRLSPYFKELVSVSKENY
jgi:hypothetical protein